MLRNSLDQITQITFFMNYVKRKECVMVLTWKVVDGWRAERRLEISDLARRAGIPERTIYMGLRNNSRLRAGTLGAMKVVFPEKFDERGEPRNGGAA